MKFKIPYTITILSFALFINSSFGQIQYKCKTYNLPINHAVFTSFYVNEVNQILLPFDGGIYMPKDSLWFLPPVKDYYFTSFAPDLKHSAFFVLANHADSSELYYLKSIRKSPVQRCLLAKISKGLYNVIFKNGVCYVWGFDPHESKIGILTENGLNWVFKIKGIIQQVQVNKSGEIFFALGNTIYQLSSQKKILILNSKILGFDFDEEGQIIVSFNEGVGVKNEDVIKIVATGINGIVQYANEKIYVLNPSGSNIYQISESH